MRYQSIPQTSARAQPASATDLTQLGLLSRNRDFELGTSSDGIGTALTKHSSRAEELAKAQAVREAEAWQEVDKQAQQLARAERGANKVRKIASSKHAKAGGASGGGVGGRKGRRRQGGWWGGGVEGGGGGGGGGGGW